MYKKRLLIGMCSWNNPKLLKACINSLLNSIDNQLDGIIVVLNESDIESMQFLLLNKIPFISLPENRGVLAIDYLKPFIEQSMYFINTNDDMLFHKGFADEIINILLTNYPCSASLRLIENFYSNNSCVVVDTELIDIYDANTYIKFIKNIEEKKYNVNYKTVSYNHPICVLSSDFLNVGGYSKNWDFDYFSGYGRDDAFAFELWKLHQEKFKFICSNKSFVFHSSSATMKRLPQNIKNQNNIETFYNKNGMSMFDFRKKIEIGKLIYV